MNKIFKSFLSLSFVLILFSLANAQEIKREKTTPLIIKSKPQPSYTLEARKANIEGVVRLKVVFLADGKIGEISDATNKKSDLMRASGLTEKAIQAAREIKFEPATKNGKPISVFKIIVYVFSIF